MPILPSKELIKTILGYEGAYSLEDNFLIYAQSDTYDACPDCFTRLPKTSSCARSWKCINTECQNSGDFEFYSPIYNYSTDTRINIYELAHKCKEWVNSFPTWEDDYAGRQKGIFMQVMPIQRDNKTIYYSRIVYKDYCVIMPHSEFTADTELEAIFKACEWILTQLKQSKGSKCGS